MNYCLIIIFLEFGKLKLLKVWLVKLGEPLPNQNSERLYRIGLLAQELSRRGHEIIWWTSTFDHISKCHLKQKDIEIKVNNNYKIKLIYSKGYKKNYSISRLLHHKSFAKKLSQKITETSQPDLILTCFPTGEVSWQLAKYGKKYNIPVIVDIRDLWPDVFLNFLPNFSQNTISKIVEPIFLSKRVMKNAYALVAISKEYLNWGLKLANRNQNKFDQIFYIGYSNAVLDKKRLKDADYFWDDLNVNSNSYICCFFGTINRHYKIETLLSAIKHFEQEGTDDILLVLCGEGANLSKLKIKSKNLKQVLFPGWVDQAKIISLMNRSKIGLCPYSDVSSMSLPNKPFEYFSGRLPILSTLSGELNSIIIENKVGYNYKPNSVKSFLEVFYKLYNNELQRNNMGNNAYKLYKKYFSPEKIYNEFSDYLENIFEKDKYM